MATEWISVKVQCPFFTGSATKEISCEGYTEGVLRQKLQFVAEGEKRRFLQCRCESADYRKCEIYKLTEQKYEAHG